MGILGLQGMTAAMRAAQLSVIVQPLQESGTKSFPV